MLINFIQSLFSHLIIKFLFNLTGKNKLITNPHTNYLINNTHKDDFTTYKIIEFLLTHEVELNPYYLYSFTRESVQNKKLTLLLLQKRNTNQVQIDDELFEKIIHLLYHKPIKTYQKIIHYLFEYRYSEINLHYANDLLFNSILKTSNLDDLEKVNELKRLNDLDPYNFSIYPDSCIQPCVQGNIKTIEFLLTFPATIFTKDICYQCLYNSFKKYNHLLGLKDIILLLFNLRDERKLDIDYTEILCICCKYLKLDGLTLLYQYKKKTKAMVCIDHKKILECLFSSTVDYSFQDRIIYKILKQLKKDWNINIDSIDKEFLFRRMVMNSKRLTHKPMYTYILNFYQNINCLFNYIPQLLLSMNNYTKYTELQISNFISKYKSQIDWDTLSSTYPVWFEEKVLKRPSFFKKVKNPEKYNIPIISNKTTEQCVIQYEPIRKNSKYIQCSINPSHIIGYNTYLKSKLDRCPICVTNPFMDIIYKQT